MKLPVSVRKISGVFREVKQELNKSVRLLLVGEKDSGKFSLRAWFFIDNLPLSEETIGTIQIAELDSKPESMTDAVLKASQSSVILYVIDDSQGDYNRHKAFLKKLEETQKPILLVLNKADLTDRIQDLKRKLARTFSIPSHRVIPVSVQEGTNILEELVPSIARQAKGFEIALARRLNIFKKAVAEQIIRRTAYQNGLIGSLVFLPGADMPILTLNQMKMVMKIAAIYEEDLSWERLKDLLAVIGGGFTFRSVARGLVSFAPGPGWLIKGGVAYSGTLAIGKLAIKYYEAKLSSK